MHSHLFESYFVAEAPPFIELTMLRMYIGFFSLSPPVFPSFFFIGDNSGCCWVFLSLRAYFKQSVENAQINSRLAILWLHHNNKFSGSRTFAKQQGKKLKLKNNNNNKYTVCSMRCIHDILLGFSDCWDAMHRIQLSIRYCAQSESTELLKRTHSPEICSDAIQMHCGTMQQQYHPWNLSTHKSSTIKRCDHKHSSPFFSSAFHTWTLINGRTMWIWSQSV